MRERKLEYGDADDRAVARDLELNARCMADYKGSKSTHLQQ